MPRTPIAGSSDAARRLGERPYLRHTVQTFIWEAR
jgi:hypothetical protein